jgi:hypothetical protein
MMKLKFEDKKLKLLEEKHRQDIQSIRQEMNIQFTQIINMIQQNPNLKYIKPELLSQKNNRKINKYFL